MKLPKRLITEKPKSAQAAYNLAANYLHQNSKTINSPEAALEKLGSILEGKLGKYAPAVDMIIRVWFNVEDFVADGEPMDQVWADIEDMCN